jgi:hypothetical protein
MVSLVKTLGSGRVDDQLLRRDDRILPITRWVSAALVPFLLAAFIILYLFPHRTAELFAWTLNPPMTALLMGAGYLSGAYFFSRVVLARRWSEVAAGFPPIFVFATGLGLVTLLHWDCFNHHNIAFIAWVGLYLTTPLIVPALWLYNRRTLSRATTPAALVMPHRVRLALAGVGAFILVTGIALFLLPQWMIRLWPWQLTMEGTAQAMGAWYMLPGLVGLVLAADGRWPAARIVLQSQMIGIALILFGAVRAWSDFDPARPITWLFVLGMTGLLLGLATLYLSMERRLRRQRPATTAAAAM